MPSSTHDQVCGPVSYSTQQVQCDSAKYLSCLYGTVYNTYVYNGVTQYTCQCKYDFKKEVFKNLNLNYYQRVAHTK